MTKEFNSQRIFWVHQHGRRFIVLEHQYGRRELMWKRSITCQLHTTHVGAVGSESHSSFTTTCAGKVDHELPVDQTKGHTYTTHGLAITSRMRTALSRGQWQPWTPVSPAVWGSSAWHSRRSVTGENPCFFFVLFFFCKWVITVQSTFHKLLCLLYTYWDIHHFGGLFISNLSKLLKFVATHREMTTKSKYQLISKIVC